MLVRPLWVLPRPPLRASGTITRCRRARPSSRLHSELEIQDALDRYHAAQKPGGELWPLACVGLCESVARWSTEPEVGGRRPEVGGQRSEVRGQKKASHRPTVSDL